MELGITGWAKNLLDGKVEIVIEGEKEKIEKFLLWIKEGSPLAKVKEVEMDEEEYVGELETFVIREFGF